MKSLTRLITSALPYINNIPHLGHMAGSHLPADAFARYSRMKGHDVLFIGGSDEHGTPSEIAAEAAGVDVRSFCDNLHEKHKKIYEFFDISYDKYSRTSSDIHKQTTQEIFQCIEQNGYISRESAMFYFDEEANRFLPDRYITGTCKKCGYEDADGDQCEKCGTVIKEGDLINVISKLTATTPIQKETEHLFLDLEKCSEGLFKWIESQTSWSARTKNTALSWLKEGLHKRAITRDIKNGIPVPCEGMEGKVFYVWFDAPIGYISFIKEMGIDEMKYWGDKESEIYHFMGKDNVPFHTIFWPAILFASQKYRLPNTIIGMQYLTYQKQKFSKSKQIGIFCDRFLEIDMPIDMMRGYLFCILPENHDADFNWDDCITRINGELIGKLGNFLHRTTTFVHSKMDNSIMPLDETKYNENDRELKDFIDTSFNTIDALLEKQEIRKAFEKVLEIAKESNKYFQVSEPWNALKENPEKAHQSLNLCLYSLKIIAITLAPFLPTSAEHIWKQIGESSSLHDKDIWKNAKNISTHITLPEPKILFDKLDDAKIASWKESLITQ
jgi:methionyl-tRNA synthetase